MRDPPSGTVTFLFTDIEGSTRLWEERPDEMRTALAEHDALVRAAIDAHGGYVFSTGGDGFAAAFPRAHDAIDAAAKAQAALAGQPIIKVRMGIHTGEVQERDGDYFGPAVNRAARIMAIAHGGQIVCTASTAELVRESADLCDLGEHRLRDLSRVERVWQVGPGDFGPLRSVDSFRSNLPVLFTSFVGRDRELVEVANAVHAHRLVTLTGVGGVGKTRLALQVAAHVLPQFEHGVWLVELAPVLDVSGVADAVAAALRIDPRRGLSLEDMLLSALDSRSLLLVLDNCEHVLDGVRTLASALLARCPRVRVLATSREGLGVMGEQLWPLGSLAVVAEFASFDTIVAADSVRMFVDRAVEALPEFSLSPADGPHVANICRRLDGIPLAIELAAARVSHLSPAEIAGRLDERFRLLRGGRSATERHQTLRAAIDWSYGLLTSDESTALDRLSVFVGGFDLPAAEAVIAGSDIDPLEVLDLVASLVDKSLIVTERHAYGMRYRLLETIRQYGEERLSTNDDAVSVRDRHAAWFARLLTDAADGLAGPEYQAWVVRIDRDIDNIRAAWAWTDDREEPPLARAICRLSPALLFGTPFLRALTDLAARAIDRDRHAGRALEPTLLALAAYGFVHKDRLDEAAALTSQALATASGHARVCALYAAWLAGIYGADPGNAQQAIDLMIEEARRIGATYELAWSLAGLITTRTLFSDRPPDEWEAAVPATDELSAIAEASGSPRLLVAAAGAVAFTYVEIDPDRALASVSRCVALAREHNLLPVYGALASMTRGYIDQRPSDDDAVYWIRAALDHAVAIDDRQVAVQMRFVLGLYLQFTHRDEWAARLLYKSSEDIDIDRRGFFGSRQAGFLAGVSSERFDEVVATTYAALAELESAP